jgi:hypothetical protein
MMIARLAATPEDRQLPRGCRSRTVEGTPARSCRSCVLFVLSALSLVVPAAYADSEARILETQPSASATLGRQESFWVRIEYTSEEPISLWARPYRSGREVKRTLSNASLTYAGTGEALGWFALTEPGDVDEIRITAGGGRPYREWQLARQPVQLRWTDLTPSTGPRAKWVGDLLATEKARFAEDAQRRANEPVTPGSMALVSGFMLVVLALLVAAIGVPIWTAWKWRGGWRVAAAVPACVILFVVLRIAIDTARDPTSHNLWPFEILQFGTVALGIIGGLTLTRKWVGAET